MYYYLLYLWMVFFNTHPNYQPPPPTRPPVVWSYTAPDTRPTPTVIVMPPCRVLSPTLTVCS